MLLFSELSVQGWSLPGFSGYAGTVRPVRHQLFGINTPQLSSPRFLPKPWCIHDLRPTETRPGRPMSPMLRTERHRSLL